MKIDNSRNLIINKQKDDVKMLKNEMQVIVENGMKFKLPYNKIKNK